MRVVVVGLGIQGRKRSAFAGSDLVTTVDPVIAEAKHKNIRDVPLDNYDAALVCTPDSAKVEVLTYLLQNRKHILVEKPLLSHDRKDLESLRDLATKNKTVCYTAYNHRFEPHIVSLRDVIRTGELGEIHQVRLFYGNGTARDVRNSAWRDQGMGVLPDLGSHLIDTCLFLFGDRKELFDFEMTKAEKFENKSPDYVLFCSSKKKPFVLCEMTLLSWRNTFRADVIGEKGSAHIECLCKWGPSTFTVRKRVLPSGRPAETNKTIEMKDPTWAAEYEHFKKLCEKPSTNIDHDLWMNDVFEKLRKEAGLPR